LLKQPTVQSQQQATSNLSFQSNPFVLDNPRWVSRKAVTTASNKQEEQL